MRSVAGVRAFRRWPPILRRVPRSGASSQPASTSVELRSCRKRLFARRTRVHVDFHANRHFDDFRSLPGHFVSPIERDGRLPYQYKDRATPKIAQAGICTPEQIQRSEQICGAPWQAEDRTAVSVVAMRYRAIIRRASFDAFCCPSSLWIFLHTEYPGPSRGAIASVRKWLSSIVPSGQTRSSPA